MGINNRVYRYNIDGSSYNLSGNRIDSSRTETDRNFKLDMYQKGLMHLL